MLGATIIVDDKSIHTWNDWKLKWYDIEISSPNPKTYTIDVPGMDGCLDLTESLMGDVKYNNRTLKLSFEVDGNYYDWPIISSMINNFLHGKKAKVILDIDSNFYWYGRAKLTSNKDDYNYGELEITLDSDAYKYEKYGSLDNWLWDPFNFKYDIARNYKNLKVIDNLTITIPGRRKKLYPYITCSNQMLVVFKGNTYKLPKGTSRAIAIELDNTLNKLTFIGHGIVSVNYRGGSL